MSQYDENESETERQRYLPRMTWIVGAASTLGYAVGLSDVCVTFKSGTTRDCVQKLYPISRFFAVGFAGSVAIGFLMLDALDQWLGPTPEGVAWIPDELAERFPAVARHVFTKAPESERVLNSHLMLLAAHPTEDFGIPGYAKCSVHIFRSPDFIPTPSLPGKVVSIGSGSVVERYKDLLAGFSSNPLSLLRGEEMGHKRGSVALELAITNMVMKQPAHGVSAHLHVCTVRRGEIELRPNNYDTYPPSGEKIEFRMPPVAHSLRAFLDMTRANGWDAECATC
jgi:hypothetical protein